jgi:hypothetical protein
MTSRRRKPQKWPFWLSRTDPRGAAHKGRTGVYDGKSANPECWAVSQDGNDEILQLTFEKEFSLIIDRSVSLKGN